ncbi:DUF4906 domain-containing protein [Bacteroides sp.]
MKTLKYLFSSILSPLSFGEGPGVRLRHIGILAYCVIVTLFLASCSRDDARQDSPGSVTTGRTIRKEITLQTTPLEGTEGEGTTRATTQIPLSEDESKIHSLTVLQFGGTTGTSKLIKQTQVDVSEINTTTGAFFFDFEELADGEKSMVYLIANISESDLGTFEENIMTLGEFEGINLNAWGRNEYLMQSEGLPMLASQSFAVATTNPAPFKLKSLLAKVVFSFDTTTDFKVGPFSLYIENLSYGVPVKESVPGDGPYRPSGLIYGGEYYPEDNADYTGDPIVWYLPENLAGRNAAITKDSERGGSNVPTSDAIYFWMFNMGVENRLGGVEYSFYLGDGTPQDFNVVRHHQYNMHVTLRGVSATDKRVELKTANCYIVESFNTEYSFLATVMGNGAITPAAGANAPEILPAALRPASAKVLWEQSDPTGASNAIGDVIKEGSVSTDGTYITFTTGTKAGNAVIGAFDDAGTLIWSWHIWRSGTYISYVPCHTPYPTATGGRDFRMMDRNLGAFNNNVNDVGAYGLHYQWGRKDPFPNGTKVYYDEYDSGNPGYEDTGGATFKGVATNGYSFAAVPTETGVTVQGAIQTPMIFYYNNVHSDWLQTLNDNLWGNSFPSGSVPNPNLGSKSIYDPCPYGYRVPPQDTWSQTTDEGNSIWATNGYQLGVGTGSTPTQYFYPAAGVRWGDSDAGKLAEVGVAGYYWSSSPFNSGDGDAGRLTFYDGGVQPEDYNYRSYGQSVRCMREE